MWCEKRLTKSFSNEDKGASSRCGVPRMGEGEDDGEDCDDEDLLGDHIIRVGLFTVICEGDVLEITHIAHGSCGRDESKRKEREGRLE